MFSKKNIRSLVKAAYYSLVPPLAVDKCSQTLYECLLYLQVGEGVTRFSSEKESLAALIAKNQLEDGGFDIGYPFYFGRLRRPKQGSAPETKCLVPLIIEYEKDPEKNRYLKESIERGVAWIVENLVEDKGELYVPYCPSATKDIVVFNGASFAQCPLSLWAHLSGNVKWRDAASKINSYLLSKAVDDKLGGLFMPYNSPAPSMPEKDREKVDYYHLAQQGEMHRLTYQYCGFKEAETLYLGFAKHLLSMAKEHEILPYLNTDHFGRNIHLWGLASVIGFFSEMWLETDNREYIEYAEKYVEWIMSNAFNEDMFFAVLSSEGVPVDKAYYPRSDAWVLEGLARYARAVKDESLFEKLDSVFKRNLDSNFSGLENHATTLPRFYAMRLAKKVLGKAQ